MSSYLSRIQFDPRLKNTIHGKYLTNFRLVLLLIASIFVIGLVQYFEIPRRLNPEVKIPIVTVTTVLPGAPSQDMEKLVTIPLEDSLKSVENLDVMTSNSQDNVSVIVLQFLSSVSPDTAQSDVQKRVDLVNDLPSDANDPRVQAVDFEDRPIWNFALTADDSPTLMRIAKRLKNALEDTKNIDRVVLAGYEEQEIQVVLDPMKIAEYEIQPTALSSRIASAINSYPAGTVQSGSSIFSLSLDPDITSVDEIRELTLETQNQTLALSDIATIQESPNTNQKKSFIASRESPPKRTVQFFVYKTKSSNIDKAAQGAEETVNAFLSPYEKNVSVTTIENTATEISDQFSDLVSEFGKTVLLIGFILLIFLGFRQAVIASFTVPLTFLSAIAIAQALGQSLNFLTLFSFLIALGLLIDDTIVVVTAMTRYYASGKFTPAETGLLVWRDFITPLWSTTATTIWSFVPLLLATGIIGEFIKPIPIIITATMLSSTSIAVLITIPLLIVFLKVNIPKRVKILLRILLFLCALGAVFLIIPKNFFAIPIFMTLIAISLIFRKNALVYFKKVKFISKKYWIISQTYRFLRKLTQSGIVNIETISLTYKKLLKRILVSKRNMSMTLVFLIIFSLVSYALLPLGLVKNEFFPKTDEDVVYVSVNLPAGTSLDTTTSEALSLLDDARTLEDSSFVTAEVGYQFTSDGDRSQKDSSFLLTYKLEPDRKVSSIEFAESLRKKYETYSKGDVLVIEVSGGPPAGADIQIKFLGDEFEELDSYAQKTVKFLARQEGVIAPEKSYTAGTSKLVFEPDATLLSDAGISRDAVGLWLRTYASGFTLDTLRLDEEQDINLKLSTRPVQIEEVGSLSIPSQGQLYPLLSLGRMSLAINPTEITHEDTLRTISVSASVAPSYSTTEINAELEAFAENLNLKEGYLWKTGGVNEENQKSVNSILQAMGLSFLLILITMVVVFGSYRQAAIVMLSIPLAVSGVFYVFGLTGTPLSFPALIGVLALFGIVVTNAIVVVAKINSNLAEGIGLQESILDAAGSRLEPVLLTSLTTIFGLLPITLSDPLWRGLGGAIISGLFFSGVIKLFFIPVIYSLWYSKKH